MRSVAESVTNEALTWPDAAVLIVLLICGTAVFIAMIAGD